MPRHIVTLVLTDDLLAFNRAVGIVRRRNLPIESLSVGPAQVAGCQRLTLVLTAEDEAVDRMVRQLRKMVGVNEATGYREAAVVTRELALVRVRAPHAQFAQLLDALALFDAAVVDEGAGEVVAEVTGTEPFVLSLVRALEPFGVIDVARSGTVAIGSPGGSPVAAASGAPVDGMRAREEATPIRPTATAPGSPRLPATSLPHSREMTR
jgi:acetolactate synthase-1/3 small subunit